MLGKAVDGHQRLQTAATKLTLGVRGTATAAHWHPLYTTFSSWDPVELRTRASTGALAAVSTGALVPKGATVGRIFRHIEGEILRLNKAGALVVAGVNEADGVQLQCGGNLNDANLAADVRPVETVYYFAAKSDLFSRVSFVAVHQQSRGEPANGGRLAALLDKGRQAPANYGALNG